LRFSAPDANDITARLYAEGVQGGVAVGFRCPTAAASRAEEEIEAATAFLDVDSSADIAMQYLEHSDDLPASAAIACSAAVDAGRYEQALFCADRATRTAASVLPPRPEPLPSQSASNRYWLEIRAARLAALRKLGHTRDAAAELQVKALRVARTPAANEPRESAGIAPVEHGLDDLLRVAGHAPGALP
jgi:hypothetical protein